jgi:hypothetical protein
MCGSRTSQTRAGWDWRLRPCPVIGDPVQALGQLVSHPHVSHANVRVDIQWLATSRPRVYKRVMIGYWRLPKAARRLRSRRGILTTTAVIVVLIAGLVVWRVTSAFPPYGIPRPTFAFSFCSPPLWARTQAGSAVRLGNCMGELYSPADGSRLPVISIPQGSTFALGCMPGECSAQRISAASSNSSVVALRQTSHGEIYFQAVGHGAATIVVEGLACIVANFKEQLTGSCPALVVKSQ